MSAWTAETLLEKLGGPVTEQVETFREAGRLATQVARRCVTGPWRVDEIAHSVVQLGVGSLPIIVASTAFSGLVISQEMAWHMDQALHTTSMIPGFTGQFVLRELGVAIPAMLLVSKAGAAMTAEVGSMKVTEQLDALRLLRIDPVGYLVFPRFVACVISLACLTMIAIAMTLLCALGVAVVNYHFSVLEYLNALRHFVGPMDLVCALVKGVVFGAMIPLLSCAYGFRCRGGAEGVGSATTQSVVASTTTLILVDFALTFLFSKFL